LYTTPENENYFANWIAVIDLHITNRCVLRRMTVFVVGCTKPVTFAGLSFADFGYSNEFEKLNGAK